MGGWVGGGGAACEGMTREHCRGGGGGVCPCLVSWLVGEVAETAQGVRDKLHVTGGGPIQHAHEKIPESNQGSLGPVLRRRGRGDGDGDGAGARAIGER